MNYDIGHETKKLCPETVNVMGENNYRPKIFK